MLCGMELDLSSIKNRCYSYYENIVCDGNKEWCLSQTEGTIDNLFTSNCLHRVMRNIGGRDQWNIEYAVS